MKKTLKRTLAIVMAIAMLFALSVSVFAYNNGVVIVNVTEEGSPLISTTVSAAEIANFRSITGTTFHLYEGPTANNSTESYPSNYTAADALIAAYLKDAGNDYDLDTFDYTWYEVLDASWNPVTIGDDTLYGLYFTVFDDYASDNGTYYIVSEVNGVYTYYWRGSSWSMTIDDNNTYADGYATQYSLDDIYMITFDFQSIRSDNFESTTEIPGALPMSMDPYNN